MSAPESKPDVTRWRNMKAKPKKKYVIVRATNAGAFFGALVSRKGNEVVLNECRRLWQWFGAASLSQAAMEGFSRPTECKFPPATSGHVILGVIEVIPVTNKAVTCIQRIPSWRA